MTQNIAEFRIIGRIAKIDASEKVTHINVAANYNRKVEDEWQTDTYWNRVTVFSKLAERTQKAGKGDLVHITGRVRQNSFERDGISSYSVDLIAEDFSILATAKSGELDDQGTN